MSKHASHSRTLSSSAVPTPLSIDAIRLRIDANMRSLFERLAADGPMASDGLVQQVYRWSDHYLESGGRRMHGIAVYLAYQSLGGTNASQALSVAAALQLYHHHTMVHDDLYDEDTSRRRWPTTHVAFANWFADRQGIHGCAPTRLFGTDSARRGAVSAFAYGKIMRALALYGIGTANFPPELILRASNLLNWHDLYDCAGQMKDVDFESRQIPDSTTCLSNAWLKTGRLFEICARIGALFAQATDEQQHAVARWAGNAGVAYQIQDDLEDIVPQSEKGVGRGIGVDLLYCKPTYLYALTREFVTGVDRETLRQWESGKRHAEGLSSIVEIIERSGSKKKVEAKVGALLEEGREALLSCGLPDSTVERLDMFARYFVSKDYWHRALADGAAPVVSLFSTGACVTSAPAYPDSHRSSALHGLPSKY